jgi:ribosomal protein S18 acetylase RimI-like enzyme
VEIVIRDARPADRARVEHIFRRASLSNERDRDLLLNRPDALVLSDLALGEGRMRVAVDGDTVVGFSSCAISTEGAELEDLFVDPDWMRRGIGTALVLDASEQLRARGIEVLDVTANPHAMHFYEHLGFAPLGIVDTEFYPALRMRRSTSGGREGSHVAGGRP